MGRIEIGRYLVVDPEICHGQMTFTSTRVPVETVLALLGKGYSVEQLLKSYPELTRAAIAEAIHLATESLRLRYTATQAIAA
jgi:uncharacterized protein (DUF433 family)